MTVTHTDGYPVVPAQVDALLIGMAERYDVTVTAADGVFPLVAVAEGNALARALLSTGAGSAPDPQFQPSELTKRVGTIEMFTATTPVNLGRPDPNLNLPVVLGGNMMQYNWTINGEPYGKTSPLHVRQGQRPTITFDNTTMMYHPIHLHGHTFQVIKADGSPGARKEPSWCCPSRSSVPFSLLTIPARDDALPQHLSSSCGDDDAAGLRLLKFRCAQEIQQQLVDYRRLLDLGAVPGLVDDDRTGTVDLLGDLAAQPAGRSLSSPPSTTSVGTAMRS